MTPEEIFIAKLTFFSITMRDFYWETIFNKGVIKPGPDVEQYITTADLYVTDRNLVLPTNTVFMLAYPSTSRAGMVSSEHLPTVIVI